MRTRIVALTIIILSLFSRTINAQGTQEGQNSFLTQIYQRDSILIADQLRYGVNLKNVEAGTALSFQNFKDTLCKDVLIVKPWTIDTVKVHKSKNAAESYDLQAYMTITSFDEGIYVLPKLAVQSISPRGVVDTLYFEDLSMEVMTMPVDTASFVPHDIKAQVRYPITFMEVLPWIGLAVLLVLVILLIVYLVRRYQNKKEANQHKDPAHIIALRKLDKYRGDKYWQPEKQKIFYSGITDVMREYIAARYDFGAMEMTTAEIFFVLKPKFKDCPKSQQELLKQLEELFVTADYVKFAKHISDDTENAAVLPTAVKFVSETYQADLENEQTPQEK